MTDIWITLTLEDRDTARQIASKAFQVNFAEEPAKWMANPIAWATLQLLPQGEERQIEAQEAAVAARRAEYEAKKEEPPIEDEGGAQAAEATAP